MARIAVVGAGVVGLSTAVCLQEQIPGAQVTVVADKFTTATTSDGAAGIFRPTFAKTPGTDPIRIRQWLRVSKEHLHSLLKSADASAAGVSLISGFAFHDKYQEWPLFGEYAYQFRDLNKQELLDFPGPTHKFRERGGRVMSRRVSSLLELSGEFDLVVNCAGLGNRQLTGDTDMVPVRGHLIRVQAPWLKHFMYFGENCYIIPGIDNVTVGGTRQAGRNDVIPTKEDHDVIMREACKLVPSLKNVRILWDWVGLRPNRAPLRLEAEILTDTDGKTIKVVHNYGHGGEGVSLSWGTAVDTCQLATKLLDGPKLAAKL